MRKIVTTWTAILVVLMLTGCATAFTKGGGDYREGKKALEKKKYAEAVEKTLDALAKNPEFEEAQIQLPRAFNGGNDYYLDQIAQAETSGNEFANDTIWSAYSSLDRMHKAMKDAGVTGYDLKDYSAQAAEARGAALEAHYNAGLTLLERGDYENARASRPEFEKVAGWEADYEDVQTMIKESYYIAAVDLASKGDYKNAREAASEFYELSKIDDNYKDMKALWTQAAEAGTLVIDVYYNGVLEGPGQELYDYLTEKETAFMQVGNMSRKVASGADVLKLARKSGADRAIFMEWEESFTDTGKDSGINAKRLVLLPNADEAYCKGAAKNWGYKRDITVSYVLYDVKTGQKLMKDQFVKSIEKELSVEFPFFDKQEVHDFEGYGKGNYTMINVLGDIESAWANYLGSGYGNMQDISRRASYPMNKSDWVNFLSETYPDMDSLISEFNGNSYIMGTTALSSQDGGYSMLPLYDDQATLQSVIDFKNTSEAFYEGLYSLAHSYTDKNWVKRTPGFDLSELSKAVYDNTVIFF